MNVEREFYVYDGRALMGWIVIKDKTRAALAFDGDGKPLGRFPTFKAASEAIDHAYTRVRSATERAV
jgi:hypothetical protein